MGQESRGIVLRERMEGQANGGDYNVDPVLYVPYRPNQLMELEIPLQPLLQSVHSGPVREQANEGSLPGTISSANQLSQFRQVRQEHLCWPMELGTLLRQQTTLEDLQLSIPTCLNFRYISIRF